MKLMYKIIIFFLVFYMMILVVNSLNVFPEDGVFYSDDAESELSSLKGKRFESVTMYLFTPKIAYGLTEGSVTALVIFIVGFAALTGILTHNAVMPAVVIVGYCFFVMLTRSYSFFEKIFYGASYTNDSMQYLAICIGAGLVVIAMITVVEMVAQGRSGE